jgi:hypothetical protein
MNTEISEYITEEQTVKNIMSTTCTSWKNNFDLLGR